MPACPKSTHEKKPRQPLRSKSHLKARAKIKQGKGNPFPISAKKEIFLLQDGKCAYSGIEVPTYKDLEYHHCEYKGSGLTSKEWQHDPRNGVGLLPPRHTPLIHMGNNQSYWKYFWIMRNVLKFGWWAGENISLEDWASRNELRLVRANVSVEKLIREVRENDEKT